MGRKTAWVLMAIGLIALISVCSRSASGDEPLYENDPEIMEIIQELGEGQSVLLPAFRHIVDGEAVEKSGRRGPFARDYTNTMAYAPDRQTALYCGGNHGLGRMNDVWEYHLGSNTWYQLHPAEGGDHARHKNMLMFMPRRWEQDPDYQMNEDEQRQFEAAKAWWNEHVVLKDGHYVTRDNEGPLLVGHTWDTLVYEPNVKRLLHGTGAHCATSPWLHHMFTGMPLEDVRTKLGRNPDGKPYRPMWMFDPEQNKWIDYASEDELSVTRGMGATMCYIPDWEKTIFYVAAQNVIPNAFEMKTYDAVNDRWENLRPNDGESIRNLVHQHNVAPGSEVQTAYSPKHRKMVAVLGSETFCYDIDKNEWSKLNADIPFAAHNARTVFAYDSVGDVFLLARPRTGQLAAYDLEANEWQLIEPDGPGIPKPPWCEGKGYYDPTHNVFVVRSAFTQRMWLYRHKDG